MDSRIWSSVIQVLGQWRRAWKVMPAAMGARRAGSGGGYAVEGGLPFAAVKVAASQPAVAGAGEDEGVLGALLGGGE